MGHHEYYYVICPEVTLQLTRWMSEPSHTLVLWFKTKRRKHCAFLCWIQEQMNKLSPPHFSDLNWKNGERKNFAFNKLSLPHFSDLNFKKWEEKTTLHFCDDWSFCISVMCEYCTHPSPCTPPPSPHHPPQFRGNKIILYHSVELLSSQMFVFFFTEMLLQYRL